MTEISQELADRLITFIREFAASDLRGHFAQQARDILPELPSLTDEDEAARIVAAEYECDARVVSRNAPAFQIALAGIRRGKELAPVNLGGGGI